MTALYIGIAVSILVFLALCCCAVGGRSDTINNTTDEHADGRNFGFEAGAFHALPNTHERQHEHG